MPKNHNPDIYITGIGVTSCIGQGKENFFHALIKGQSNFGYLNRPGRQIDGITFLGAEISALEYPENFPVKLKRNASFASVVGLLTVKEAWDEALLDDYESDRIGLVVGGSNTQQRHLNEFYQKYREKIKFLNPTYAFSFFDTDISAVCSEYFGIKGMAYSLGGASASGQLAVIEAAKALQADHVDVCIVLGSLMDLSYWELQGFKALGAMGSEKFKDSPAEACRPFDSNRDGFIYGENCGAIVLEKNDKRSHFKPYARLSGWSVAMDANRNPNPSYEGELKVIKQVMQRSNFTAAAIDYINPHGTGSPLGDETELNALRSAKLEHARINSTKSITGHGLTSAGNIEVIAALLQMNNSQLHPSLNLNEPIDDSFNWLKEKAEGQKINRALTLSMGFGGINTALCLENIY